MSKAQLKTYHDKVNQVVRMSIREQVYGFFKMHLDRAFTIREAAKVLKKEYRVVQPRVSELVKSQLLKEDGVKHENGQTVTRFTLNRTPPLFPKEKKTELILLKEAMDNVLSEETRREVFKEFEYLKKNQ